MDTTFAGCGSSTTTRNHMRRIAVPVLFQNANNALHSELGVLAAVLGIHGAHQHPDARLLRDRRLLEGTRRQAGIDWGILR